ncbi:hypothetical protein RhiXN_09524 [Rhizoctonia solani]|uniref:Retrotransposon gag domain-containing protein n=1 Tax=Rhizoctonia solani TaxID=456999 RepID=A0A8H8P072_9AGAM|nr:uncharacterized protein RhiXN_09524 [Rhizoctonia solani]QRW21937.1 hypothetical protein RhiXN_09524 [Rhizoctonia solani]
MAQTNRAPPTQRVLSWPTPAIKTCMIADAPKEREVVAPRNAEAAVRVLGEQEPTPGRTNQALAAVRAPKTPSTTARRKDTSLDNNVDYSSTNESTPSQSTGTMRHQTSCELEDTVRKLRKQNKRLEKKIVTQARSGYKAQTPKAYKGKADINKYNMFILNYKLYLSDTKLSNCNAILTMSQFLEDKVATWYMMNVAPDPEVYTMETIYIGLYEYCFPPDFKEEVQCQYNQKQQGDLSVQDYFAKPARLHCRLREAHK